MVLDHLAATFDLAPESLDVLSLTPRDLPEGAAEFYVEANDRQGREGFNCIVLSDKVYCSGPKGEFERLLREQALLEHQDLDAVVMMRLYSLFALPRHLKYLDAKGIARNPHDWRAYPEVTAPALESRPDGGVTLIFYATPHLEVQPSKWMVNVTRACEVELGMFPVTPR